MTKQNHSKNWRSIQTAFLLVFIFTLVSCSGREKASRRELAIPLNPCNLPGGVEALCSTVSVPENREVNNSRQIDLHVAVLPADDNFAEPDPLFMLAGGPGQAATEVFPPFLGSLEDLNEKRDIVLVDQRGTGQSNPLHCEALQEEDTDLEIDEEAIVSLFYDCVQELTETADLTQYTTDIAMTDLDQVREALGYEEINVFGASYGTRAAQAYARLYPQYVRTMVLDSVTSPELIIFQQMPGDGQRALDILFDRCTADEACSAHFPDFQEEYRTIFTRLAEKPAALQLADPLSGEKISLTLTEKLLGNLVYTSLYSTDLTSLMPFLVHHAFETGDYGPLVSQGLLAGTGGGINLSLLYAVTCAEDAPLIDPTLAASIQEDTLFALRSEMFMDICEAFPETAIAPDFRQPLALDVPVLLLSGGADPVTPPNYAEQVAANLPDSLHLVAPEMGHGLFTLGCVPDIITDFIEQGSSTGLEVSCLENVQPGPFFINFSGPAP